MRLKCRVTVSHFASWLYVWRNCPRFPGRLAALGPYSISNRTPRKRGQPLRSFQRASKAFLHLIFSSFFHVHTLFFSLFGINRTENPKSIHLCYLYLNWFLCRKNSGTNTGSPHLFQTSICVPHLVQIYYCDTHATSSQKNPRFIVILGKCGTGILTWDKCCINISVWSFLWYKKFNLR